MGAQVAVDRQELENNDDPAWNICKENESVVFVQIQVSLLLSIKCVLLNWVYQGGSCFGIHPLMPEGLIFLERSLLLTLLGSALGTMSQLWLLQQGHPSSASSKP